ncbi:lytic polysaccharide monooxygenase [Ramaria rubella]|nr:lytic polysaccharide monooxygenase [Ramaria rubella]
MYLATILLASAALVSGHGYVQQMKIGNTLYDGWNPFVDPYLNPIPETITRLVRVDGNGPIVNITGPDMTCGTGAEAPTTLVANVNAGDEVTFFWTPWPDSHSGPVLTYMGKSSGNVTAWSGSGSPWFKIDQSGYDITQSIPWATNRLIANNNTWTVTIPSTLASGQYLLRHELLALQSAGTEGGAQFYTMCAQINLSGSGSKAPSGLSFPGTYQWSDPGITFNIYQSASVLETAGIIHC